MKVAVTADLHLTSQQENPERFSALKTMLDHIIQLKIEHVIFAGDLFNEDRQNYSDLLVRSEYGPDGELEVARH